MNKRYLIYSILLSIMLVFSSCTKYGKTVNYDKNAEKPAVGIKDNNSSYPENEGGVVSHTPSADENDNSETASKDEDRNNSGNTVDDSGCETAGNNETKESQDAEEKEILKINGLVRIRDIDPDIVVDLKYATENNFTGRKIYPNDVCVLQEATALKLANANREFMEMGYRIKVWDAYRPVYVQKIFWEIVPDSRYVANPYNGGSKHNRGTAVDITLVDMEGNELEMPSGFDDFTGKGSRNSSNMSENARKNMELLTDVMVRNGFTTISSEWWHFNDSDSDKYGIIDVNLDEFLRNDISESNQDQKASLYLSALENMKDVIGESRQIVFVSADSLDTKRAEVYTFEKINGRWNEVFEPMKAVIGSAGLSYDKKEGDKKSPVGAFPVYRCFGRQENPGTRLIYTIFEKGDFWVDDANSLYYNTYQKGPAGGRWNSAEDLYSTGEPYKYFIVIEYNTENPVAGKGSAIFMHIWKGEDSSTSGCTAVSEENLLKLMKWLDPSMNPMVLQFPVQEIQKIARQ